MPTNNREYNIAYYNKRRDETIALLGGKCAKCGCEYDLQFHHKNGYNGTVPPNGTRGGYQNLWSVIKLIKEGRAEETELLCYECHPYTHGKKL